MKVLGVWFIPVLLASLGCSRPAPPDAAWPMWTPTASETQALSNLRQAGLAMHAPEGEDRIEGRGRKLVYRAEVDLLVEDLSAAGEELRALLKSYHGIVANEEVRSYAGAPRVGLWRVRVPVDDFEAFLQALAGVGEPLRSSRDVQDVTRSHSEIEEQIKNLASEAEGLRELLKRPADKLADTLTAREHLLKVTNEMEGLKARLRRMQAQAEYSTVVVRLGERKGYVPDAAPSFGTSMSRAFSDSWQALLTCGRGAVLGTTMAVPWLPVVGVVAVPIWLVVRRHRRARTAAAGV
jgi:hypothetical protein